MAFDYPKSESFIKYWYYKLLDKGRLFSIKSLKKEFRLKEEQYIISLFKELFVNVQISNSFVCVDFVSCNFVNSFISFNSFRCVYV